MAPLTPDRGALLFVHGLGSSQATYADRAAAVSDRSGIRCLTFDLSGHGDDRRNIARYSVYDHLDDVIAAYDYLVGMSQQELRIAACGASYGAYLAALLTARRTVQRLVLRAPALARDISFPDAALSSAPSDRRKRPETFDSLVTLFHFRGPVLIVDSDTDERIRHLQIVMHLAACADAKHEVTSGARHALSDPTWDAAFVDMVTRWFCDF